MSFQRLGDRVVLANRAGTWTVWTRFYRGLKGTVGPGYVGRASLRDGERICEGDATPEGTSGNDPRWQGLAGVAWHHCRSNGDPEIWNRTWSMVSSRPADPADPFGVSACRVVHLDGSASRVRLAVETDFVDRYSAAEDKRVMAVRHAYTLLPDLIEVVVTLTQFPDGIDGGPAAFVKEPKLLVGVAPNVAGGSRYDRVQLLGRDGSAIGRSRSLAIGDPAAKTLQFGHAARGGIRLTGARRAIEVLADGWQPGGADPFAGAAVPWTDGLHGLDGWAVRANGRPSFETAPCPRYCLQGPGTSLTRQWEVATRPREPQVAAMFHGWEGGYGGPDCLCCARALEPGERWSARLAFRVPS